MTTAAGIDWSAVDVQQTVDGIFRGEGLGSVSRDDRTPIDRLVRAHKEVSSSEAKAIGQAVARWLSKGSVEQKAWALKFYELRPMAAGGDSMAQLVRDGADGYSSSTRNPMDSSVGHSLRESLLYQAAQWKDGSAVDSALLDVLRDDTLAGDGGSLIATLARHDKSWVQKNLSTLIGLYPDDLGAIWKAQVDAGADPEKALRDLLPHTSAKGRKSLSAFIRFSRGMDMARKKELVALLG